MPVSRPSKLTHSQTVLYEIDMLRYSAHKLHKKEWQDDRDEWICLEAFLVHFRNLVEFFGRPKPRKDDLSIAKPEAFWPDTATRPPKAELMLLQRRHLWDKYEGKNKRQRISKYLHHCTEQRIDPREWNVGDMYNEISELLDKFVQLLPDTRRAWTALMDSPGVGLVPGLVSSSTATGITNP